MKINEKNNDKAELENLRLELTADLGNFKNWAAGVISGGNISEEDEGELETRSYKMDLKMALYRKMAKRYLLKLKEPAPMPNFNN